MQDVAQPATRLAVPASLAAIRRCLVPLSWSLTWPLATRFSSDAQQLEGTSKLSSNSSRKAAAARRARPPRPLPKGNTLFTPTASPGRQVLEQRSATPLLWLHQLPAWVPPILAVILLI